MITVTPAIALDEGELQITFVRASGPGGQNVNKVSTAVQLRFDVVGSPSLPDDVRARLMESAAGQINADGILVIKALQFRTQERNRQAAIGRLVALIQAAAVPPVPRHATRPTYGARQERLAGKRRRSGVKSQRRSVASHDPE
ncbi:MAG: aminoacyl-tRNA hydrolase [Herpetosiphonaceae bacterium]|nr:aminoacyl-tRNA hydrolase [Herpetosiphonaceae bacterium]